MEPRASLLSLLFLIGCNSGDDDNVPDGNTVDGDADTDSDTDTDTDGDCDVTIASLAPSNGSELVLLDTEVEVTFSGPLPSGAPWSVDVTGAAGTAVLDAGDASATWTATAGTLPAETTLTVDAAVCNDSATSTFTTLPPPIDIADLENNTYVLNWSDISIDEPQYAFLIEGEITIELVLLELGDVDAVALDVQAAAAVGEDIAGTPAPICESAVAGVADFTRNPYLEFGPETLEFVVDADAGTTSEAEDFTVVARVMPGGAELTDLRITALLATEDFAPGGEDCSVLAPVLGGVCMPCTVSDTGMCLFVEGSALTAALAPPGVDILATCGL